MSLQYDYQMQKYREAMFQSIGRLIKDGFNTNTNIIKYLRDNYKNDAALRENIRKLAAEGGLYLLLSELIRPIVTAAADDDERNLIKQLLAYTIERTLFETLAPYNVLDMMNVIKEPFAIMSFLQNIQEFLINMTKITSDGIAELFTDDKTDFNEIVKTGPYRGMPKWLMRLIKLTPFHNLLE